MGHRSLSDFRESTDETRKIAIKMERIAIDNDHDTRASVDV